MGSMEWESNHWIWDGVCYPHLFGGLMLTVAIFGLSTGYFGSIGVPGFPYSLPDFGIFQKKKCMKKKVRVYMDGCFDLMHYGHANALRQARALGDELVVGMVSDEEIIKNKGPPVLSMEERMVMVSGLKWVDEVIANAPYAITENFMNSLFDEYKIDYIIHGDDPCLLPDGTDAYALAKKAGRYKQIKRTEGVSSTDIVGYFHMSSLQKMATTMNMLLPKNKFLMGRLRMLLLFHLKYPSSCLLLDELCSFQMGRDQGLMLGWCTLMVPLISSMLVMWRF
ncbi:choline-phosphate cytidylyltransferase A isoform X2 [Amborella trichopoda]|uniref:choline-phosphate cytidylyltransferase A isoform X2 n=1 Tax=Amborella trichopoda TaxID=13333 RepID=UPI0009C0722A|nr:choline-phosphate cytidylyltransferase A isoform X2 [Amborella trichopoda]|eukprot:XP_020526751.1 choline-phosphate cytidylyltransferase A isoform X2 [Amborella trichopoda]